MLQVFRIARCKWSRELSGYGASLSHTNRWNSYGIPMLYTAQSRALAVCEVLVHLDHDVVPRDMCLMTMELEDDALIQDLALSGSEWPLPLEHCRRIGDSWVRANEKPVLRVPSALIQGEYNYIFNPRHADFDALKIAHVEPFRFDSRWFLKQHSR